MTNGEKALMLHEQWCGKLSTASKCAIKSREDLALAYTPGVAEPCKEIHKNPEDAYKYTIKSNT
ncbi:MAG: NAD-dependent malic enzyme, partial [Lachnospiraceae bacterium]|nr:NAD-dependent malic enzyme [Lachnospiraceae bacterium]